MGADRCQKIEEALQAFALDGAVKAYERYGSGHINDTFRVTCEKDGKEILEEAILQLQRKEYGLQELEEKILRVAMVFSLEKRKFVEFAEVR